MICSIPESPVRDGGGEGVSGRLLGHGIAWFCILLVALWLGGAWLVVPWVVAGRSMEPALSHGDRVLVDLWTFRQRPPRVGELVLFEGPEGEVMVKRLAPKPAHGRIRPDQWGRPAPGAGRSYWLLGDNPGSSRDSRRFGAVPEGRLRGRVILRYWPLSGRSDSRPSFINSYNSR